MSTSTESTQTVRTIAILDEQIFYRDILVKLLNTQSGLKVIMQADFSDDSLHAISQLQPDIILADPCLNPEANLVFIERLLVLRPDFVVLLIAPPCDTETFVRLICAGVAGVFLKTQGFEQLLKAIKRVLAGELWFERSLLKTIMHTAEETPQPQISEGDHLECLSKRERQIVELVVSGFNTQLIAQTLHISEKTVRNHIYSIYGKLEVSDRLELARFATQQK